MSADRADYARNKEARKISAYRRQARLFIRNYADENDINELKELLFNRKNKLDDEN